MGTTCKVDGCGRPLKASGLCNSHYHRLRTYGDPLGGSRQRGYVTEFYERVVLRFEGDDCLIWPYAKVRGYAVMGRDSRYVSRLLCVGEHGFPPSPEHQAAHSCGNGDRGCVNRHHIRWATPAENQADRREHGTHIRGERQWQAKLTLSDVVEIKKKQGLESQRALANRFGVSRQAIRNIFSGRSWSHVEVA